MEIEEKASILLIDDEEALRNGVRRILELEGYDVEVAENGTTGIIKGTTGNFDVALIDMKMPDIGGLEVLREIRRERPNTVCYIATAYASYETAIEATKIGADGYILKPFTPDELLNNITMGIRKRRLVLETERLRKEREARLFELAFERSRLNVVIRSLADGVLVVNMNKEVVYYNPAALKYLQLDDIKIGKTLTTAQYPEISEIIDSFIDEKKADVVSSSIQIELLPNMELVAEVTCSPVPNPDSSLAGVVIVVKNITKFKEVEKVKSQFVSMVSHELKAPVAATIGFLEILMNKKLNPSEEQKQDFLKRSNERLKGLLSMVNDLLDISRIELNRVVREIVAVDIRAIIAEVLNLFKLEIDLKKLNISTKSDEKLPNLYIDKLEIERVFTNLISNAIKYNVDSGLVEISLSFDESYLQITIADTGIGLKPEERARMFTEFFRAKNEKTKGIRGTGLGMSIVKRTVDSYAGTVSVESEYGKGTEFILRFPLLNNK